MSDATPELGSYFVSNYPPYGAWTGDAVHSAASVLSTPVDPATPLGVYVHVPFCRKRCRFCYFKVYTERPSAEIRAYVDALESEAARYAEQPAIAGREAGFLYFGGGTPSFLSNEQLRQLFGAIRTHLHLSDGAEVTFECEPGTLRESKVATLRELGVTRLSLGVESFDERLLELNGRAHGAKQIVPAYELARAQGFDQVNIDLIAGMLGETDETWAFSIERTLQLQPDSVTIYQMEVPYNTAIAGAVRQGGELWGSLAPVATRRRWKQQAFEALMAAGYRMSSGYTLVKGDTPFVYRDSLWHGADMLGLGVSAFGHLQGVHLQNHKHIGSYLERVQAGELPLQRGLVLNDDERLIREWILQLKLGHVRPSAFEKKYEVDPLERFAAPLAELQREGLLTIGQDRVELTLDALLQVDLLLPRFFLPVHGGPEVHHAA